MINQMRDVGRIALVITLLAPVFYVSAAEALDYKTYKTAKASGGVTWDYARAFVNGVGDGFLIANAELTGRKEPLLYCQPDSLVLNGDNLLSILNDVIKKTEENTHAPLADDAQIEAMLLVGLQHTFPCKS